MSQNTGIHLIPLPFAPQLNYLANSFREENQNLITKISDQGLSNISKKINSKELKNFESIRIYWGEIFNKENKTYSKELIKLAIPEIIIKLENRGYSPVKIRNEHFGKGIVLYKINLKSETIQNFIDESTKKILLVLFDTANLGEFEKKIYWNNIFCFFESSILEKNKYNIIIKICKPKIIENLNDQCCEVSKIKSKNYGKGILIKWY